MHHRIDALAHLGTSLDGLGEQISRLDDGFDRPVVRKLTRTTLANHVSNEKTTVRELAGQPPADEARATGEQDGLVHSCRRLGIATTNLVPASTSGCC
jgi:hypothetical protein